ncbi:MAG: hypothetical protein AB2535_20855 [Candidatus Thiodiazotropha endolucinida]
MSQTIPARTSVVANSGDSISSMLGTSDPTAVEAFMRANGLSDSTIYAGEQYVMPNNADYAASTGEMGQAALNQDNARIAGNRTDQNQLPLSDVSAGLDVNVNLGFLHPDIPDSRAESMRMMDHGLVDAQRQEQLSNIAPIMGPINDWWEGVKGRAILSISDPLEALDQGLSKSFPFYDALGQVSQEELSQVVNRASEDGGTLDLKPQAFDELLGVLPVSGVAGTTKLVLGITPNNISRNQLGDLLGSGGNKDVFAFGDSQAVGVLKPGKNPSLLTEELTLLNRLDELGLPTVNARGPMSVDGNPALLFDRFAQGSKDIVRLERGKVRTVGQSSLLNQRSIDDLTSIRNTLVEQQVKVNDLQFLIGNNGRVVIADPLDAVVGSSPSKNNLRMIDLLIKSAQGNL